MIDIQAGDVVVAIRGSAKPSKDGLYAELPVAGRTYRVLAVGTRNGRRECNTVWVAVEGLNPSPFPGYHHEFFRKVQKADAAFTAQMRALRPVKTREAA